MFMDLSTLLHPIVTRSEPPQRYAMLILNQPLFESTRDQQAFQQHWMDASLRVCADGAANYVHAWIESARENGTPLPEDTLWPHLICGDLDSLQSKTRYFFQEHTPPCEVKRIACQDTTDLHKCLMEISERSGLNPYSHVLIWGGLSGRFDQTMATIHSLHQFPHLHPHCPPLFIISWPNLVFTLDYPKTTIHGHSLLLHHSCGLVPLRGGMKVTTNGLKWDMEFGHPHHLVSTSNQLEMDPIMIEIHDTMDSQRSPHLLMTINLEPE